jgi:predicted NBD/HSP70 family sugar kinase
LADDHASNPPEISHAFKEAGKNMGFAVDTMLSILDPEQILLTGVAHRHPAFLEGLNETLSAVHPEQINVPVTVSEVTSDQAAIWVGLNAFVFSPSLNIDQLKN